MLIVSMAMGIAIFGYSDRLVLKWPLYPRRPW